MTVVRELVTRLGFQVDRQGIQQFNQSILGIKTRMAIAAGAVGGFIFQTLQSIRSVGDLILDTDLLAKRTGIAFEKIIQLREAAKQFRIEPAQFDSALRGFSRLVNDAKFGIGQLFNLSRDLKVNIRDVNGNLKETEVLFYDMVDAISKIGDEKLRIEAFARVFGEDVAEKFNEFFKNGSAGARELAASFKSVGDEMQKQREVFAEYEKNLTAIESEFSRFKTEIVIAVAPAVTQSLQGINEILRMGREELGGGILGALDAFGKVFTEQVLTLFGADTVTNLQRQMYDEEIEFQRRLRTYLQEKQAAKQAQNITVDSTINIEVPPGTTEEQQRVLKESIEESFQTQSQEMIRQLQNNNPLVE